MRDDLVKDMLDAEPDLGGIPLRFGSVRRCGGVLVQLVMSPLRLYCWKSHEVFAVSVFGLIKSVSKAQSLHGISLHG